MFEANPTWDFFMDVVKEKYYPVGNYDTEPTWDFFMDAIKEKYYIVGNYDNHYMRWITLYQEWKKVVSMFKNTFHTFYTKLGTPSNIWF
jgi:hypothetical protein